MPKPFRFGVQVSAPVSAREWADKARKLESLGYSTLFMPDHFGDQLAPLPAIAMAAAHTTTLRVGSLVFGNDYKHPAILAKEAATIDLLSDGRLELGIGAGWLKADYDAVGMRYDENAMRVDRFEEAVQIVKRCLAGESFSFSGRHYTLVDHAGTPRPVQQPRPPILIGAGGPRMLALAGREADIVGINPNLRAGVIDLDSARDSTRERTDRKAAWVREAAGDRWDDLEIQIRFFVTSVTADRRTFGESIAALFGMAPEAVLESGTVLVGTEDEIVEDLQRRRERWGVSYVVVGDDNVDEFAPVVARLAGT